MSVMLETSVGDIIIDLYTDKCPNTTRNFLKLCKCKYYNGVLFHNVQKDYIVQTGDPTGTGRGGESMFGLLYGDQARYFEDEFHPSLRHKAPGTVSMANAGLPNTNGSQFLITVGSNLESLDDRNTVFGFVAEGMDVVQKINEAFVDKDGAPYQIIRIRHTHILDDPFPDPAGLPVPDPDKSPMRPVPDQFKNRLEEGQEIDLEQDEKAKEEADRLQAEMEARSRAEVLEMIGDLPVADVKPPDNVLFVCKLNPVTESHDLELIFSRFGTILSCEVIRDQKTDDSLGYAFIEFETEAQCEQAYLKMDNVLIDDRRVHVDFSQSVSKLRQQYGVYDTGFFGDRYRKYVENLHIGGKTLDEEQADKLQEKKFQGRRTERAGGGFRGGAGGGRGGGRGGFGGGGRGDFVGGRGRGGFGGDEDRPVTANYRKRVRDQAERDDTRDADADRKKRKDEDRSDGDRDRRSGRSRWDQRDKRDDRDRDRERERDRRDDKGSGSRRDDRDRDRDRERERDRRDDRKDERDRGRDGGERDRDRDRGRRDDRDRSDGDRDRARAREDRRH